MDYTILQLTSLVEAQEAVRKYIKNGWKPQGGIIVTQQTKNTESFSRLCNYRLLYTQAMIRDK